MRLILLAHGYEAWDALKFRKAYNYFSSLTAELERDRGMHKNFLLIDLTEDFKKQKEILRQLLLIDELSGRKSQMDIFTKRECMISLMFTIYQNACVRSEQEKYDMAALLMYRLLEMIEQKRLANYGLNISHMDYDVISYEKCGLPQVAGMGAV